jgi:WD40 repeat protein
MQPLRGSGQVYLSCGFSPDGQTFAAGGIGHVVELWNLADPAALTRQIDTAGIPVTFVNYTPGGDLIVARMHDAFHFVAPDGEVATTWPTPLFVMRAALTADGTKLVTAGDHVVIWEVGREFHELDETKAGPGEYFTAAAIEPDGSRFATARVMLTGESVIEIWDTIGGGYYRQFPIRGLRTDKLAWSPDGRVLAGLVDKQLTIWDAANFEEVFGPLPSNEPGDLLSLAFHPFAGQLITGSVDGIVSCWDLNSFRKLTSYRWEIGPIYALAFAADGLRAAAAGHGAIILWDFDA